MKVIAFVKMQQVIIFAINFVIILINLLKVLVIKSALIKQIIQVSIFAVRKSTNVKSPVNTKINLKMDAWDIVLKM